jgi:uncharacterized membrane protein (UPF0182 family)
MSDFGNIPRIQPRPNRKRHIGIGAIIALLFLIVSLFRNGAVFYTDFLWFQSVDLTSVWSSLLFTKVMLALISGLLFFGFIFVNLWIVDKYAPKSIIPTNDDDIVLRWNQLVGPRRRLVRTAIAAVLALFAGVSLWTSWSQWMMFTKGGSFGVKDPQFNMDIGFFVFKLPFLNTMVTWLFTALVFCLIVSVAAHYLNGAIPSGAARVRITSAAKVHLSVLLGLLAIVRAGQYYLRRYELSFSDRGVTQGANYTDVNFLLPALWFLILVSIAAGVVILASSRQRGLAIPVITVVMWGVVSLLITSVIPAGVQKLSVQPAEIKKEAPYIERNINATRAAIGLDKIKVHDYDYTSNLDAQDLQNNAQTIRNVRLWNPSVLQPSYQRLQETRSFFKFDDVDVDRYPLNGEQTQVMLALRELNLDQLPAERRSWVNEHLQFTHGYGAVVSPANAVTSDGKPDFTLKDVPTNGEPKINTPQIYFGEQRAADHYSIVGTSQPEIDYVSNEGSDVTSSYKGQGGVALSNVFKKAAFAARVGDVNPLISGLVGSDAKAMYLTNVRDRAEKVAPFLKFDKDAYPVILDGRIKWIQDAYTTTDNYPYGQKADTSLLDGDSGLKSGSFNYVRNSVKVVTDAYDGDMKFYVVDDNDPLVDAWAKVFPDLFEPSSAVSNELRAHFRYPEDLYKVQSQMFGQYHMEDPGLFYGGSDRWNIAQSPSATPVATAPPATVDPETGQVRQGQEARISPYYLLMKLPGEQQAEFITFQPYVPYSQNDQRKELSAFLTAKSDPANYGQLDAFVMPRDQQIDGPMLVDARINQTPAISQQITLLSRQGSSVRFGDMLIIPMDNSLLYIRPLYVEAQQTKVPEFKAAIVVHGDKIAMENTLQLALSKVFGSSPDTLEQNTSTAPVATDTTGTNGGSTTPTTPTTTPSTGTPPADVQSLLNQANDQFTQADQALRNGDLAGYQNHVKQGMDLVRRARGG